MSQEQYQVNCKLCGNQEVTDSPDNWKCICQTPPKGISTFHICANHNYRFWGSVNAECIKCIEDRANGVANNLKSIQVDYGTFGTNIKKRNHLADEGLAREKAFDREQKRIEQEQRLKKEQYQNAFSINKIPVLLESLNEKLDKLLQIHSEGFNVTE